MVFSKNSKVTSQKLTRYDFYTIWDFNFIFYCFVWSLWYYFCIELFLVDFIVKFCWFITKDFVMIGVIVFPFELARDNVIYDSEFDGTDDLSEIFLDNPDFLENPTKSNDFKALIKWNELKQILINASYAFYFYSRVFPVIFFCLILPEFLGIDFFIWDEFFFFCLGLSAVFEEAWLEDMEYEASFFEDSLNSVRFLQNNLLKSKHEIFN